MYAILVVTPRSVRYIAEHCTVLMAGQNAPIARFDTVRDAQMHILRCQRAFSGDDATYRVVNA